MSTVKKMISIPSNIIDREGGVVILSLHEYEHLCKHVVPVYYLQGQEAENLDHMAAEGLETYRKGKTKKIRSLAELD